jgi:pyruvate,water dikinase
MAVLWLDDVRADDLSAVGGKAASLGEMTAAGLPVPPAFVVSAGTYRAFIEDTGIETELFDAVDVDPDDSAALAEAAEHAQQLIEETPIPDALQEEILAAYDRTGEAHPVAVRSSATAEDLPDASFAGQQETFLNVTREDLLDRVRECWGSLFTQRAIYYREEQGFDHADVDIAVVVQEMVDAEKSGVMFTSHPSTGAPVVTIEAAWGLGEAVVSGAVTPDNYVIDRATGELREESVADKKIMHVRDTETGETVERPVPEDRRSERVLTDEELDALLELGEEIEDYYGEPQDVEWAIADDGSGAGRGPDGTVYLLQSRPITTISETTAPEGNVADGGVAESAETERLSGLGASPGKASGEVKIVDSEHDIDVVEEGDIIVSEMTTPDMVPAMKRAAGIVTDEGGMTSHAAIVSRELGVPAVVGAESATDELENGRVVTIDGEQGTIEIGTQVETEHDAIEEVRPQNPVKPMTATEVKVNVSIPDAAERAAATGADGVGLLRMEHMILSLGKTPERFIADEGEEAYVQQIVDGIERVADEFYPRPVRVRTLDAPTDEFRQMEGGEDEPVEHNPMLGYRGIRRSLDRPEVFAHELEAFRRLYEQGYDNVEIMFPLVNDAEDVRQAKELMAEAGIDIDRRSWGVMIETPASAFDVDRMAAVGIDFASFGTNDLTQYTLAVDRNNGRVADRFDELHPAVVDIVERTIEVCREHGVATSICGQAGSDPEMARRLVHAGITSISANIDAVRDVQHEVKRVEQKLLLDSVR